MVLTTPSADLLDRRLQVVAPDLQFLGRLASG